MGRTPCCEKVGLKRGRWTAEEDETLVKYIAEHGEGSWRSLPKNAGLLRCGKSCRLRWINYLRADLKRGHISKEEEDIIIRLHTTLGNRWSLIASHLPGRTDNEIKNYWNSHLSRQIHTFRRTYATEASDAAVLVDVSKLTGGGNRRVGRTERSAKTTKKEDPESTEPKDESPVNATSASTHSDEMQSVVVDPVQNQGNNSSSISTSDGLCSEDATGPMALDPIEIGPWEAESEMEAMLLGSTGPCGLESVGEAQGEDLLDLDWEGFVAQLWDDACLSDQNDLFMQGTESQEIGCNTDHLNELESFESWLLSDSC